MNVILPTLNESFILTHRKEIKPVHQRLLQFIYGCAECDYTIRRKIGGNIYYLINYSFLANHFNTSYKNIQNWINRLCGDELNPVKYIRKYVSKKIPYSTYSWISINEKVALNAIDQQSELGKRINNKMNEPLFEVEEAKVSYSPEAVAIVNMAINRYHEYFPHKIPKDNEKPTKTYTDSLRKVTDIYNGLFIRSRVYPMSKLFTENKSFNIEGWRDKVKEVKGDWVKVRKLILYALNNFKLMHEPNMMPYSKDHLQTNLSLWFYDGFNGDGQSQFVQCLYNIQSINGHNGELKADRIFETLPSQVRQAGNAFFDMNPNMGAATLWGNIEKMMKWCEALFRCDYSARYWASTAYDIPLKFAKYCLENNIRVTTTTLDVNMSACNNAPWSWFVQDAVQRHRLHKDLATCRTPEDVEELYSRGKKPYYDIPF